MKRLIFCLAAFLVLATACRREVDVDAEMARVQSVLEDYVTSIENEDMGLYSRVMAHDETMVNYSAFGDPIVGWDALEKIIDDQNQALSETDITVSDQSIHFASAGNMAWATSLWSLKAIMGQDRVELPLRCSWVLEKRQGGWVIVHFHKSIAMKG